MPDLSSYNTGSPIYSKQLHISRGNRSKGVEEEGGGKSMHPFFLVLEIEQGCVKCTQQDVIDTNACNSCNNPCDAHTYPFVNSLWTSRSLIHNLIQGVSFLVG